MNIKKMVAILLSDIKPVDWVASIFLSGVAIVGLILQSLTDNEYFIWFYWYPIVITLAGFNLGQILKEEKSKPYWALLLGNSLIVLCAFAFPTLFMLEMRVFSLLGLNMTIFSIHNILVLLVVLCFFGRTTQFWFNKLSKNKL